MPTPPKSSRAANKAAAKKPTPPRAAIKKATARATAPKRSANGTTATPRDDALTPSWGQTGRRADHLAGREGRRHRQQPADQLARPDACSRTSTSARRSCTSTTSASPSAWSTPAAPAPTARSSSRRRSKTSPAPSFSATQRQPTPVFVRFSTVAGSRGSADTARDVRGFATKFYTQRGQLRPRRQQHPGVLHPGRHQVPRPHPRGEARARSRDPAGADRPRHVLGLRVAAARSRPTC